MKITTIRDWAALVLGPIVFQYLLFVVHYIPFVGEFLSGLVPLARLFLFFGIGAFGADVSKQISGEKAKRHFAKYLILCHFLAYSCVSVYGYLHFPFQVRTAVNSEAAHLLTYKEAKSLADSYLKSKIGHSGVAGYALMELKRPLRPTGPALTAAESMEEGVSGSGDVIGIVINFILQIIPFLVFWLLKAILPFAIWGGLIDWLWWYLLTGIIVKWSYQDF